jgi:hypothetical protein
VSQAFGMMPGARKVEEQPERITGKAVVER